MAETQKVVINQVETFGSTNNWKLLMSTKFDDVTTNYMYALEILNNGCIVKTYNKKGNTENLLYVPNVHIVDDKDGSNKVIGRHLENNS